LAALGVVLPAAAYFWIVSAFGVDTLSADQWFDVKLIQQSFDGTLRFNALWGQHGENRVLFQNLVMLVLAHLTSFDVLVEEYISAVFLLVACVLLILTHHRRSPGTPWFAYCPVAVLLFSLAQAGGTLFGYSLGWYLILLAFSATLFFLDRPTLNAVALSAAIVAGVLASFSSLQGLFVWPVGFLLILLRDRGRRVQAAWIVSAAVTAGIYFYHWDAEGGGSVAYALHHPFQTLRFFLFAVGDVLGIPLSNSPDGRQYLVLVFGIAIVVVCIWSIISAAQRVDSSSARPIGIAVAAFGLLFAVAAAGSRVSLGISNASFQLYVPFDILILLGTYLIIIDRSRQDADRAVPRRLPVLAMVVVALVGVEAVFGTGQGLANARSYHSYEVTDAVVTANIRRAPDGLVVYQLGAGYESAPFIRQMVNFEQIHHLALFSTAASQRYAGQALPVNRVAPTTVLSKPSAGASLHGVIFLSASATDPVGVTRVEFDLREPDGDQTTVSRGYRYPYGWLGSWNTRSVPDGTYLLRSVAFASGGLTAVAPWTEVHVAN
jgi:hypothetical protein